MLAFDPTQRPSLADIKAHEWFKGEVPSKKDVRAEIIRRKNLIELEHQRQLQL